MNVKISRKIYLFLALFLFMVFVPLLSVALAKNKIFDEALHEEKFQETLSSNPYFIVFDEASHEVSKIDDREFIYGTVATEMPASFETEALKAQAVAAYTYFNKVRHDFRSKNSEGQPEITVDTDKCIYYTTKEKLKSKWGANFDGRYEKIKSAVDSVFPEVLEENGTVILAMYHAISSGCTESSKDVFGKEEKYLKSVASPGDKDVPGYETSAEFTEKEFKEIVTKAWPKCKTDTSASEWVKDIKRTPAGMVKSITICSHKTDGQEVRAMFSLRSPNFDLEYREGRFIFKVRGYGHGVGMSQHGAQNMAKNGADYKQILSWYYPETQLVRLEG